MNPFRRRRPTGRLIDRSEGSAMGEYEGGCLCGQIRFRIAAQPGATGYCHCRMCQKNSGAPAIAWVIFPAESFRWIAGTPATYRSSARAKRSFCANCGSYMLFTTEECPTEVSVNTASLDDPDLFPPRMHIFTERRISWFSTHDELPHYEGYGPVGPPSPSD
jgi:hypothetical protein